jgi:hypothetical protein
MRDQEVKEMVSLLMTQRYEIAKIDEARHTSGRLPCRAVARLVDAQASRPLILLPA